LYQVHVNKNIPNEVQVELLQDDVESIGKEEATVTVTV
jgi:hypothetical protein